MKKIIAFLLTLVFCIGGFAAAYANNVDDNIKITAEYLKDVVKNPVVGSIGGEWAVIGLARSGIIQDNSYFENYYRNVESYVKECKGELHNKKYTEYSRVILALSAIGKNPEDVAGYNLLSPLSDFEKTIWQGTNGPIWALIAIDSGNYEIDVQIQQKYIEEILKSQFANGGWGLNKNTNADADITAMALTALSKYRDADNVKTAIEKGLNFLSSIQNDNGGFVSMDGENSESTSQVLVALSTLGIDVTDSRFVKNGKTVLDNLFSFKNTDGSFRHTHDGDGENLMATEQCLYALVAYDRMKTGKTSLYDMSDVKKMDNITEQSTIGEYVHKMPIINEGKTFSDIQNHQSRTQIESLASRNIINGKKENVFDPNATMTRAEFATIVVRALGLPLVRKDIFNDVQANDWYYPYIATANVRGIVNGVSATEFNPNGVITKEEASVMVARAAKLCNINTEYNDAAVRDVLSAFTDYITSSSWARSSLAFCYDKDILDDSEIEIQPKRYVTRAEIAVMLYNLLELADLL